MRTARPLILTLVSLLALALPAAAADGGTSFRVTADDAAAKLGLPDVDGRFTVSLIGPSLFVTGSGDERDVQTPVLEAIARFQAGLGTPCDPVWRTLTLGGCAESFEIDLPATPEQFQVVCHFEDGEARLLGRCDVEGATTQGQAHIVLIPGVQDGTISYRINGSYDPKD